MPGVSGLKKERKFRLAENKSRSHKIINKVTKQTRKLQNDLISDTDWSTGNEYFTYKKRPFIGPSSQKLSNFLAQQNTDVAEDTNNYYQIIHNSFLLELMKQTIFISCKSKWNGDMSVAKREGTVYLVFSHVKLNRYIYFSGLCCSLVFTCHCSNEIKINTSKQCPKTSKRDINIRSVIGMFILSNIIRHKINLLFSCKFCWDRSSRSGKTLWCFTFTISCWWWYFFSYSFTYTSCIWIIQAQFNEKCM